MTPENIDQITIRGRQVQDARSTSKNFQGFLETATSRSGSKIEIKVETNSRIRRINISEDDIANIGPVISTRLERELKDAIKAFETELASLTPKDQS